ncbi:MAG: hypothetical protein ABIO85_04300 [Sphingomicrobium sp.]
MREAVSGSCHCGAVTIRLAERPSEVTDCNCTFCTALGWRLVYAPSEAISIDGPLDCYVRKDLAEPCLRVLRCRRCGIATHWEPLSAPPHDRMGVNAALLDDPAIDTLPVRMVDGLSWTE